MTDRATKIILLIITAATIVAGWILYPQLPETIATHWNIAGEADGYSGKFWGVFLSPAIIAGTFFLYLILPMIDPLKKNIELFRKYYNAVWVVLALFFAYIFIIQMAWNLGSRFNFGKAIVPALAVVWYFLGVALENSKRNWFMGIRTPWTISSDVVWEKTHKLGGVLFKALAVISLIGLFFDGIVLVWVVLFPVALAVLVTTVYSYVEYKKINN